MSAVALPVLVDRARAALAEARDAAELLEARDQASATYAAAKIAGRFVRAKGAHDALLAAVWRAQGDALEIEALAKRRLADEYDAAQARGEVAGDGRPRKAAASGAGTVGGANGSGGPATAAELGLTRKDVFLARAVRDAEAADPGCVRRAIDARLSSGLEPTKAAIGAALRTGGAGPAADFGTSEIRAAYAGVRAEATEAKRVRRAEREAALGAKIAREAKRLGRSLYGVIYGDPAWRFEVWSRTSGLDRAADNHYPTMTLDAVKALGVPAADDCVLFLWVTAPGLADGVDVMRAWGFTYVTEIVWTKDRTGTGYWARNRHESLLIGTKGSPPAPAPGTQPDSVIPAALCDHSVKPEAFAEMIEQLYPTTPKVELFARRARPGWDVWGAEAPEAAE